MSENEQELTAEEIAAQQVLDLPAREAMSVITPFLGAPFRLPMLPGAAQTSLPAEVADGPAPADVG
jgi:hypothetical protein